jgi:hypothetical protein
MRVRPWVRNTVMAALVTGVTAGGMCATAVIQDLRNDLHADQHVLAGGSQPAQLLPVTVPSSSSPLAPAQHATHSPSLPQLVANVGTASQAPGSAPVATGSPAVTASRPVPAKTSAPAATHPQTPAPAPTPEASVAPAPSATPASSSAAVTTPLLAVSASCLAEVQVLTVEACVP